NSTPPLLIGETSGPDINQLAALDALLFMRDPFPRHSIATWLNLGADQNTRLMIFASNVSLNPGETSSAVTVNLAGCASPGVDIAAEDVRVIRDSEVAQITFRLPDNVAAGGQCTVTVKLHNSTSNVGTFRIAP